MIERKTDCHLEHERGLTFYIYFVENVLESKSKKSLINYVTINILLLGLEPVVIWIVWIWDLDMSRISGFINVQTFRSNSSLKKKHFLLRLKLINIFSKVSGGEGLLSKLFLITSTTFYIHHNLWCSLYSKRDAWVVNTN